MNISENMKLHQWAQDMADHKASGLTRQQWCDIKGIALSTYDYRCKKVRRALEAKFQDNQEQTAAIVPAECCIESAPEPVFAKVNLQVPEMPASGISIKLSNAEITFSPDTPAELVRTVLEALAYAQ